MEIPVTLPAGFGSVRKGNAWGFGLQRVLPWVDEVMTGHRTLHAWAAVHPQRRELAGRGVVFSVPAPASGPDAAARWVIRHYYRGGAVARYLDDRYLSIGDPRPIMEARAAVEARQRGIPTPSVVAGGVYRDGMFYRADLVTEEIPDASDLAVVLFDEATEPALAEEALTAAGRLVRCLERAGVFHPDLNAKNIVIQRSGGATRAHLVDLDQCTPRVSGVPAPAYPMRRRLERSLRKFERRLGRFLPEGAWKALHRGFEST